jgi:hypothetical protein
VGLETLYPLKSRHYEHLVSGANLFPDPITPCLRKSRKLIAGSETGSSFRPNYSRTGARFWDSGNGYRRPALRYPSGSPDSHSFPDVVSDCLHFACPMNLRIVQVGSGLERYGRSSLLHILHREIDLARRLASPVADNEKCAL